MKVVKDARDLPPELTGCCLALGNFDGVHRGHQAVLSATLQTAAASDAPPAVMVFEPHPREFFRPQAPVFRLTPLDVKLELFAAFGLQMTVVMDFGPQLASLPPEDFIQDILIARLGITHAIAGFDFHFGKDRLGTPEFLKEAGVRHGFGVDIVEPVSNGGGLVSSSQIRRHLEAGEVAQAAKYLGYRWFVRGEVVKGDQRGRELGFPTANVRLPASNRLCHGIYAVRMLVDGPAGRQVRDAVASFGIRPTFAGTEPVLEVFAFDFSGDIYGRTIEVEFVEYIREEKKFDSVDDLVTQMNGDAATAKEILARAAALDSDLDRALGFAGKATSG